jgi:asparagine synthase (glutamine-hydrolysing)
MTNAVRHRGPDDEGYLLAGVASDEIRMARGPDSTADFADQPPIESLGDYPCEVALGHRRLSILDLSRNGHGPLSYCNGDLWITFNGEIYNYVELRAELQPLGYEFVSGTDTEVLLAAYQEWGLDCLPRFNGMFAFAIWDARQKRLFCARDRMGIKPFYYTHHNGHLTFASEIKGLLANPLITKKTRPDAIYDYLVHGATPDTFFDDIQQLPGSHALTFNAEGDLHIWRYFDVDVTRQFSGKNYQDHVAEFRALLTDAIRLRLRSDVPVGSSLSGGLDSSSVVTLMNRLLQEESGGEQQRVFCAVYAGEPFNEKPHMDAIIQHTGADAHFTHPDSATLKDDLTKLVWHQDEPVSSSAVFAQFCVMRLARQNGVTVLLDGQGGDEVLAGYHFYYGYLLAQALRAGRPDRMLAELRGARSVAGVSWASLIALTGYNLSPGPLREVGVKLGGGRLLSHKPIDRDLLNPAFANGHHSEAGVKHRAFPTLTQKLYDDVFRANLPTLLRYEDRNSMAFHIEARVPFLDHRLVEFAFSLGADEHIRDGWSKVILRDAMRGLLPESIRMRRDKEGYTTPHDRWMRELTPQINALFGDETRARQYLSPEVIASLQGPQAGAITGVWRLVNLEAWLRAFELD